ncbi:MAG: CPBP family intramembrane metalloprotease [Candidatus Aenigmarchaeota archaeon]|nr:CPBP family intramembrane metalloprotease [Candidatus Aenigmarchaeota archaeon]MCK5289865.1 CPBP family intramembrane metalloprotease [Candidatus Aenigmarchaeota archaeon]MCK5451878.1 CPBP family intramembrane metalloprotease [Candidatus Aenigmarchaeota archaeon]
MAKKRKDEKLNLGRNIRIYALLFLAGAVLFQINVSAISYMFTRFPWTIPAVMGDGSWWLTQTILIKIIYVGLISPILEELIFRKYVYGWFLKKGMDTEGIIISSALFSLYHILFGWGWMKAVIMFPVGIIFAIIYRKYNIKGAITAHLGNNLSSVAVIALS